MTQDAVIARARGLLASGHGLAERLERERVALQQAAEAELAKLRDQCNELSPKAKAGDAEAAAVLERLVALLGDLFNTLAALGASKHQGAASGQ